MAKASSAFGVVFAKKTAVVYDEMFARASANAWLLNVRDVIGNEPYAWCKDACLFMTSAKLLDDNSALCMYIQAGESPWSYCGCVANAKPSDVFALRWPVDATGQPYATAAVGISVETLASALEKESVVAQHKETFAKRVAEDLFRFMQSFQTGGDAQNMVVPTNILEKWYEKFIARFRRDPGFIDRPRLDAS